MAEVHAAGTMARGMDAVANELLTLENSAMRVQMWPRMGGKIVSIVARNWDGEHELLHPPLHAYNTATEQSDFAASDAGGWDECLPSVAACRFGSVDIPDHGDVWRKPWETVLKNDAVLAHTNTWSLPLRFSRWMSLDGPVVHLRYSVTNTGTHGADFLWSAHPLFCVEEGDRILLPDSVHKVHVESSTVAGLAGMDGTCAWPHAEAGHGKHLHLNVVGARDGVTAHKLFAGPLVVGWCGLYRARLQCGIVMRFDPGHTPFAGLWICQGAWPQGDGPKQYTVALEPTTAMCDSLEIAARLGQAQHLLPQAEYSWPLQFEIFGSHQAISYDDFHALASTPPRH